MLQCMMLSLLATVPPVATATGDAQAGKAIYERSCVGCHGRTGQGGRMAAMLAVPPRNLADQAYMGTRSDQQLFRSEAIYERSCVGCHGPTGQGGRMAAMLAVPPRNLADQAYMGTRSDQQLF